MRILVTVSPLMYREAIALSIHDHRPDSEVLLAPPRPTDVRTVRFGPHVLVHDAEGAGPSPALAGGVVCRVEVLYTDSMVARVSTAGGGSYTIEDARMDDLLAIVDEAEGLASGPAPEGEAGAGRGRPGPRASRGGPSPPIPLRPPPRGLPPRRRSPRW